ncbi:MAG: glycosyltransferase [Candidatus Moranbacteria bacterium]|jgi:glycosyltransferase involved in cell wall biosynthesis|nr:glycosyltransferase [Candidatus Moranbacteria bacterium]
MKINKKIEKDTFIRRQIFLDRFANFPLRYGGWAISEDFAYDLVQYAMFYRPRVVLDLGTGTTTALLGKVAQKLSKNGHEMRIISVDSDKDWLNDTKNILKMMDVDKYVDLVHAPIVETEKGKYYDSRKIYEAIGGNEIDLLIIDGPPKPTQNEARYPAMPFFEKFLTNKAVVFLDDGQRDDEKAIVKRWEDEFPEWKFDYKEYMKGGFVIYKEKEHAIPPIISNHSGIVDYAENNEIRESINNLTGELNRKDSEIRNLSESITKKDSEIKNLSESITKKDSEIKNLSETISEKNSKIRIIQESKSFKIGSLFFRSIKNPWKIITFPINFLKVVFGKKIITKNNVVKEIQYPKVAVIMTCYNSAKYIEKSIDSILNQTYKNLELIIVDDCSTDNSIKLIEGIKKRDNRVKLIKNKFNRGTYWSKNFAILFSDADFITTQDSDDTSNASRIELQIKKLLNNNADVATCNYIRVDGKGKKILNRGVYERVALIGTMFRKEVFSKVGYFDSVRYAADAEMNERIVRVYPKDKIVNVSKPLYIALDRAESLTRSESKIDLSKKECNEGGQEDLSFLSQERQDYVKNYRKWHNNTNDLYMPFPLLKRKFDASKKMLRNLEHKGESVVASMASFPARKEYLKKVVEKILPQVDQLNIYLNEYDDAPDFLNNKKINISLGKKELGDIRDNGKFFFANDIINGYHFTIDDDLNYPNDYVNKMIAKLESYDNKGVVGLHGVILSKNITNFFKDRKVFNFSRELKRDIYVNLLGTGTIAYHTSILPRINFSNFETTGMVDLWFAIECRKNKIPMIAIARKDNWLKELNHDTPALWEEFKNNDKVQTSIAKRYEPWSVIRI